MLIHAPGFFWQGIVLFVLWGIGSRLTMVNDRSADELCRAVALAVKDALSAAHIDHKLAADAMGLQLSRFYLQLHGDPANPIALWRLLKLPMSFWLHFAKWLFARIAEQRVQDAIELVNGVKRS